MSLEFVIPAEAVAAGPTQIGASRRNRGEFGAAAPVVRRAISWPPLMGGHLVPVFQLMQDVGEGLGMHQAVLDGHLQELFRNVAQQSVDGFARAVLVVL